MQNRFIVLVNWDNLGNIAEISENLVHENLAEV